MCAVKHLDLNCSPPPQQAHAASNRLTVLPANALMLLAALAWRVGNVSQKLILDHLDPFAANGLTCLAGAAALSPLALAETKRDLPKVQGSVGLLLQVAVAFTVATTLMQFGYAYRKRPASLPCRG